MAKFKAATNIRYGVMIDGEHHLYEIPAGAIVTGLPKEGMKELWDAGALVQVDDKPAPEVAVTVTKSSSAASDGEGGGAAPTPSSPEPPAA
jgi:hypothetical protein